MMISDLHDDLLILILVRLQPECLGQLKSVSKSWNSVISSQKFIELHLNLNQSRISQKPNVILYELWNQIHMLEYSFTGENMSCNCKLLHYLPELLDERIIIEIVGSSNGLLCLLLSRNHDQSRRTGSFDDYEFALCNPLTKSTWDLPGNQWRRLFNVQSLYGFWHDDVNDDYKVVILNHISDTGVCEYEFEVFSSVHEYEFEVYRLRSNSWSSVRSYLDFSYEFNVSYYAASEGGVLFNCALHWIILKYVNDEWIPDFILELDLRTYTHKILPMPEVLEGFHQLKLSVLNGFLVLTKGGQSSDLYDLWVLKDYSWIKITLHNSFGMYSLTVTPLALLEDRILVAYDSTFSFHSAKLLQFVGSLVQPYPPLVGYKKIFSEHGLKNFEDFHVHVNSVSIDSEFPEHVRRKYYELCRSKNSFLHERFVPCVHSKLAARMISEAVNIADSIRACKATTSKEAFEKWGKSLRSFELLGMNVGFLRDRVRWLLSHAYDSEEAFEGKEYGEVIANMARIEIEIEDLEVKHAELNEKFKKYDEEVDALKLKAESYEIMFQEKANAPW